MDITQLILDDHHEQRRLFAIVEQIDRADTATLQAVWARLSAFLEVHAAAEEEVFYPQLLKVGLSAGSAVAAGAEEETLDAIHDRLIGRSRAVLGPAGGRAWARALRWRARSPVHRQCKE